MKLEEKLRKFGLDERKILIYLYLVKEGESTAYKISKSTHIPKATVYNDLESLIEVGLASKWKKNGKLHYSSESITRQKTLLEEKIELVNSIIPDIHELRKNSAKNPEVKIYTGKRGIKTAFEKMMEQLERKDVNRRYIFSHPNTTDQLPRYIVKWAEAKENLGVFTHSIAPAGMGLNSKIPEIYRSNHLRELRFIPQKYMFDITMSLDGDLVVFFVVDQGELYVITIESAVISKMLKQIFIFIWDQLPKK